MPGKINFLPVMRSEEFDVTLFDIAEQTTHRKDRFDVFSQILDGLLKGMNTVFQILLAFLKSVSPFSRANKLMHKKKIVRPAISLFPGLKKFQTFFKLRQ